MSASRDAEYTRYVSARLPSLRRLAVLLCQDWQRADDLVQVTITKLYVHWARASAADHTDAYARSILVREFAHERRSGGGSPAFTSCPMPGGCALASTS